MYTRTNNFYIGNFFFLLKKKKNFVLFALEFHSSQLKKKNEISLFLFLWLNLFLNDEMYEANVEIKRNLFSCCKFEQTDVTKKKGKKKIMISDCLRN